MPKYGSGSNDRKDTPNTFELMVLKAATTGQYGAPRMHKVRLDWSDSQKKELIGVGIDQREEFFVPFSAIHFYIVPAVRKTIQGRRTVVEVGPYRQATADEINAYVEKWKQEQMNAEKSHREQVYQDYVREHYEQD